MTICFFLQNTLCNEMRDCFLSPDSNFAVDGSLVFPDTIKQPGGPRTRAVNPSIGADREISWFVDRRFGGGGVGRAPIGVGGLLGQARACVLLMNRYAHPHTARSILKKIHVFYTEHEDR